MPRRKKRKYRKYPQKHRLAPMPKWFNDTPWGTCRWCNKDIFNDFGKVNSRRRWHKDCVHEYLIITDPKYAKRQVKKRDKGVCAKCKKKFTLKSEWQCDHKKPLIEAKGDINYWMLGNLQTLCNGCHSIKTAAENSARRKKISNAAP